MPIIPIILFFLISFGGTIFVLPHSIRKLRENGFVSEDMYKVNKPSIPTNAGIILLFVSFITISIVPLFVSIANRINPYDGLLYELSIESLALLLVVSIYALYGLVDDLVDIGRKMKLFLPVTFSYPLISLISPESIWLPVFGQIDLTGVFFAGLTYSDLFRVAVIPIYVMVVTNIVNMHSGYNGLQSGLSIILITTLIFKSLLDGTGETIHLVSAFLGSLVAFWLYNKYPSKVFEGNVGSLLFGSIIGGIIVLQGYWWFGFFILIPHTFNFILWVIWLYLMRIHPEEYLEPDGQHKKFANLRADGSIKVPNRLTLKWIPNYYFRLNERQSCFFCYLISLFFCISGLIFY